MTALPSLPSGSVVGGKYRVDRVLGAGGMGMVVAAHHLELDQPVALKFLHPDLVGDDVAVRRLLREARAAASLRSEHVRRVHDVGRDEGGAPFIVMEYLDGVDLADLLAREGPLDVAEAVELVIDVCDAMGEAHRAGIIHRDLKPQNLFLARQPGGRPVIKVLDFGISKRTVSTTLSLTATSQILGSPTYLSPEQLRTPQDVDARADVWSLGVVLYELLAGRPPFESDVLPRLAYMILSEPVASLSSVRAEIPAGLDDVVAVCLEKDRSLRHSSMAALAVALRPFAPRRAR